MEFDVVSYLRTKNIHGRQSGNEQTYPCFFECGESSDSKKRKLYVNRDTGYYICFVCLASGGPISLQQHFGDEYKKAEFPSTRLEILSAAARVSAEMLSNNEDILRYLMGDERGLEPETIIDRQLGYVPASWSLSGCLTYSREELMSAGILTQSGQEFFSDCLVIPYVSHGRIVQLRARNMSEFGPRYKTMTGDNVRFFNSDRARNARELLIVEGELDCMAIEQVLAGSPVERWRNVGVLSIPGVNAWPQDAIDVIGNASRIFIAFDADDAGRKAATKLAERIGPRAGIVDWPKDILEQAKADGLDPKGWDWSTWIARYKPAWEQAARLLRSAGNRRLLSVADAAERWRNRSTLGGLKLGLRQLDSWIEPGLLPGQVMIPLAKAATGKTLFLVNLTYNMRKHRILFVTLEMTAEEIYERLARIVRFYFVGATDSEIAEQFKYLMICDENRLSEKDLMTLVDEFTDEIGAKPELLIVDYLGYYARGFAGSEYERISDAVMQLKAEAKTHSFAVISPHQVNRGAETGKPLDISDARGSGVVEETADFLLALFKPDDAATDVSNKSGKIRLEVLKSRHGNAGRICSLQMSPLSLVVIDVDEKLIAAKAAKEVTIAAGGITYEEFRREQLTLVVGNDDDL